jgi:hypothetical protein
VREVRPEHLGVAPGARLHHSGPVQHRVRRPRRRRSNSSRPRRPRCSEASRHVRRA